MKKNIIIYCIEGYSAPIKDDKNTVSSVIDKIVKKYYENIVHYIIVNSKIIGFKYKKERFNILSKSLNVNQPSLVIIGKSMGGVNAFRLYKKMFNDFIRFERVSLVLIDAHAPFPFLIGNIRDLRVKRKWRMVTRAFTNIYQKRKYPKGASLYGATIDYLITDKNVTHGNIIKNHITKELIDDSFRFAIG